jgi:hypothetical protein
LLLVLLLAFALGGRTAHAWQLARVEPRADNLEELLGGCEAKRAEVLERNRQVDAWVTFKAGMGVDVRAQVATSPVPECGEAAITSSLAHGDPSVWALAAQGEELYATVNLPVPAVLVSGDAGRSWRFRHAFLPGYNVERAAMLRGIDAQEGLLAVATENGVLLSTDGGRSFTTRLAGMSFWAVAIARLPSSVLPRIVAGGNGTSYLSDDGGSTWSDLGFSRFTAALKTGNRYLIDHITSVRFDPHQSDVAYVGTGSHLYRVVLGPGGVRWQAMEGAPGARVFDDSTVYNIAFGTRMMISTCNGVYYLESLADSKAEQAAVRWGKFRDAAFTHRGIGGPSLNLRAYFVTEDPDERGRVLIADFAGLYEGRSDGRRMRWRRIPGLPYYSPIKGYPEYTSIAWTANGDAVVGTRYRGIFIDDREPIASPAPTPIASAPSPAPAPPASAAGRALK